MKDRWATVYMRCSSEETSLNVLKNKLTYWREPKTLHDTVMVFELDLSESCAKQSFR